MAQATEQMVPCGAVRLCPPTSWDSNALRIWPTCHSPEEIRLVNAFCRFVEVAAEQASAPAAAPRAADADGAPAERSLPSLESILVWTPRPAGARQVRPAADDPTLGL